MTDPVAKAKWLLHSRNVTGIPAESLSNIAKQEEIDVLFDAFPDDPWLDGLLLFDGSDRAIIVNTHIDSPGRHNFTFAHELGHYFLEHPPTFNENGQSGIRCSAADIEQERMPREVQANRFAVELLMPEDRFRLDMAGAPIDFALIGGLATRYMVSKHACSNRIAALTTTPCIIIRSENGRVRGYAASRSAKGWLQPLNGLPEGTTADMVVAQNLKQSEFTQSDVQRWLTRRPSGQLFECTHMHAVSKTAMTILRW
jgi:Zn-dependent peptidase ImmA (M78 family)